MRTRRGMVGAVLGVALLAAACSSGSDPSGSAGSSGPSSLPAPTHKQAACNYPVIERDARQLDGSGLGSTRVIGVTVALKTKAVQVLALQSRTGPWQGGDRCLSALLHFARAVGDAKLEVRLEDALQAYD